MNLTEAYLLLAVMLAVVAVVSVLFKGKSGLIAPLIFVAGLITALVAGLGFRLREVTEGPFVFVDTLMWVLCGAAFSYLLYVNGTFQFLFAKVVGKKRSPAAQMFILILFIGLPGMITGTALASVATTGLMAGRYLLDKGMEKSKVVEVVTVGALMGMLLPPLCVPAMAPTIARQGLYPGAFEGYFLPILILALPALIVYCALAGRRVLGEWEADGNVEKTGSAVCLIPLAVVAVLVLCYNFLYFLIPYYGGYPVIYLIGFVLALIFKCKGANPLIAAADGIRTVAVELALQPGLCLCGRDLQPGGRQRHPLRPDGDRRHQRRSDRPGTGTAGAGGRSAAGNPRRLCGGGAGHLSGQQLQLWKL